jgi:enolase-phosphatase E1
LRVEFPPGAIEAVVLDIEGTTTPIAFVYDVLFPFARRHLREHLRDRRTNEETRSAIRSLRAEWADDVARGEAPPPWVGDDEPAPSSVAAYVEWLMDRDRKSHGLKLLQGYIWERGYRSGALKSEVFPDVAPALAEWRRLGVAVAIYSSGSVLAQRLLFGHTAEGDLTAYLRGFFDLEVGPKTSPESYRRIAAALVRPADRLLFVSDAVQELEGARAAGCHALLCVRPGNPAPPPAPAFAAIHSLNDISLAA